MTDSSANQGWVSDPRFELNELRRPTFTVLRKGGLDPDQVEQYVVRLEKLAKEFAKFARELETRISHAQAETREARLAERKAVDDAMLAAFDAKERIILQAEERAWEIEEEAHRRAAALVASVGAEGLDDEAVTLRADVGTLHARMEDLEIQLEQWQKRAARAEADLAHLATSSERGVDVDVALAQTEVLYADLEKARADRDTISAERDRLAVEMTVLQSELDRSLSAEPVLAADLDAAAAERERHAAELEELRAEIADLRARDGVVAAEAEAARSEAEAARSEAEAARSEAEAARSEAEAVRAEAEAMRAEAGQLKKAADDANAAAEKARKEAARLVAEAEALKLPPEEDLTRKSRYARNSAQLPSMGESAGDVLHSVGDLRRRRPPATDQGD